MQLFDVPNGRRVRVTSKLIRWVERNTEHRVAEDVTWEGTTTGKYFFYKGHKRRLMVDHTIGFWQEYGIWQRNTKCVILN